MKLTRNLRRSFVIMIFAIYLHIVITDAIILGHMSAILHVKIIIPFPAYYVMNVSKPILKINPFLVVV